MGITGRWGDGKREGRGDGGGTNSEREGWERGGTEGGNGGRGGGAEGTGENGEGGAWGGGDSNGGPPGEELSFAVRFRRARAVPVDLYFLLDLSYSMRDDLRLLQRLGSELLRALHNASSAARIGATPPPTPVPKSRPSATPAPAAKPGSRPLPFRLRLLRGQTSAALLGGDPPAQPLPRRGALRPPGRLPPSAAAHRRRRRVQAPREQPASLRQHGRARGRLRRHGAGGRVPGGGRERGCGRGGVCGTGCVQESACKGSGAVRGEGACEGRGLCKGMNACEGAGLGRGVQVQQTRVQGDGVSARGGGVRGVVQGNECVRGSGGEQGGWAGGCKCNRPECKGKGGCVQEMGRTGSTGGGRGGHGDH